MSGAVYRRTERAGWWLAILITALFMIAAMVVVLSQEGAAADGQIRAPWLILTAPVVLLLTSLEARAMTISVDGERIRWRFGLGLFRKSVAIDDIVAADVVKPSAWAGVGIHYTGRKGWLYNVNWGNAVRLRLRSGKTFMLGTDDPSGLIAALRSVNPMVAALER